MSPEKSLMKGATNQGLAQQPIYSNSHYNACSMEHGRFSKPPALNLPICIHNLLIAATTKSTLTRMKRTL
jgi:hypothetical protein